MEELEGATITEEFMELEGKEIFQCYKVVFPDGVTKLIPKSEENSDFQRIKIWNARNGSPLKTLE